ncbi:flagellar assembly protein FliW [Paenibacillus campi]|uniref:flagellar assembly protein FliW n=1 Tax=Paenibacillus campi TaxID=3106031 RepID=UPI002AFE610A|nr:flagellar assembly protein FliW [Paenibacillus sp. SGZ-1014]
MSDPQLNPSVSSDGDDKVFTFAKGIPGFPELTNYVYIPQVEPFSILQPLDHSEINFILLDPFVYFPQYEIALPDDVIAELGITSEEQVVVRNIVSWNKMPQYRTVNLVAPIVFNLDNLRAKQIILQNTDYTIRHPLQSNQSEGEEG